MFGKLPHQKLFDSSGDAAEKLVRDTKKAAARGCALFALAALVLIFLGNCMRLLDAIAAKL